MICVYTCQNSHTRVSMYIHTLAGTHAHTHTQVQRHTCMCMQTRAHTYTSIHMHVCTLLQTQSTCTHTLYTYTCTHTCTFTHVHTHIHITIWEREKILLKQSLSYRLCPDFKFLLQLVRKRSLAVEFGELLIDN
jgi:hypothetical protein